MSRIKDVVKKYSVENDQKRELFSFTKNICWIKDDRDSVTRPKSKIEKNNEKIELG